MKTTLLMGIFSLVFLVVFVGVLVLIVRALLKYIKSKDVRQEKCETRKSLGKALKKQRTHYKMTNEFAIASEEGGHS